MPVKKENTEEKERQKKEKIKQTPLSDKGMGVFALTLSVTTNYTC